MYMCGRCGRDTYTVIYDVCIIDKQLCFLCYEVLTEMEKQIETFRGVSQKIQEDKENVDLLEAKIKYI